VAPGELRERRELLRHHLGLTRPRTARKHRVHALLARQRIDHGRAKRFGPSGRAFLSALALPEPSGRRLQSLLALIADCERALPALKRELQACANDDPPVCVRTRIAGVGSISALLVIAELGEVSRVPSCRHLASWAGRTPRACATRASRFGSARSHSRARPTCAGD
jgi:transposase